MGNGLVNSPENRLKTNAYLPHLQKGSWGKGAVGRKRQGIDEGVIITHNLQISLIFA